MRKELSELEIRLAMYGFNQSSEDSTKQVEALRLLVLALLMEVEALREAFLAESHAKGEDLKNSIYGKTYLSTALLTHNSAGPSGGLDKLLWKWLFSESKNYSPDLYMREILMLRRLGFSETDIEAYRKEAEEYEMLT